ncbi:DNA replication protein psf2, partial [Nowakowskiella sp. JEL0078]
GFYGPFRPPNKIKVPVWLAITLKRKQKCSIQPPKWLDREWLKEKLLEEFTQKDSFCALPFHFTELAEL